VRSTIKIQEFAVPVITRKDQEGFDRKAVAAWNLLVRYGYDMKGLR
jgi:hypothetical protein